MKNEFLSYEQSWILKELGFDEPCFITSDKKNGFYSAPITQQALRFFRDKYGLYQIITTDFIEGFSYKIYAFEGTLFTYAVFETYEEAEQECLDKLIEIAKERKI